MTLRGDKPEDIAKRLETAKRELYEETGAVQYSLIPVCVYSVTREWENQKEESYGMLYYAEITEFEKELHSEIEQIEFFNTIPEALTYPEIQPYLLEEAQRRGFC